MPTKETPDKNNLKARANQLALERSARREAERKDKKEPSPVSLGPVGAIVDALINTAPDKILELTDFDRNQVTLIPQLRIIDEMWENCIEVAEFREDATHYKQKYDKDYPIPGNMMRRFVFLLAQCRRSLGGKTQKALEDLALADLETRAEDREALGGSAFDDKN